MDFIHTIGERNHALLSYHKYNKPVDNGNGNWTVTMSAYPLTNNRRAQYRYSEVKRIIESDNFQHRLAFGLFGLYERHLELNHGKTAVPLEHVLFTVESLAFDPLTLDPQTNHYAILRGEIKLNSMGREALESALSNDHLCIAFGLIGDAKFKCDDSGTFTELSDLSVVGIREVLIYDPATLPHIYGEH